MAAVSTSGGDGVEDEVGHCAAVGVIDRLTGVEGAHVDRREQQLQGGGVLDTGADLAALPSAVEDHREAGRAVAPGGLPHLEAGQELVDDDDVLSWLVLST